MPSVKLAEGHAPQWITATRPDFPGATAFEMYPGQLWPIVPDDSTDHGIGESLAKQKVDQGIFILVPDTVSLADTSAIPPAEKATEETIVVEAVVEDVEVSSASKPAKG
jgi:hypothetical protein